MNCQAISTDQYLRTAFELVEEAEVKGVKMRLLGSVAVRVHCANNVHLLDEMRRALTDIDFMAYKNQRDNIRNMLEQHGYVNDSNITMMAEGGRYYYEHPETKLGVDVFIDKLDYCHPIVFKGRLELDRPTIPLADIVLEKLQIVQINEKDFKDLCVLMLEHGFGNASKEQIDIRYICSLLSGDWGFYHTATTNLDKLKSFLPHFEALDEGKMVELTKAIDYMRCAIDDEPKSFGWKMRAKVGTGKRWYKDISAKTEEFNIDDWA
ncbi:MAG: hypothetical protein M1319_04485 [Chloroflexi bacterium]|nr:hypothetical protein [Chloroflexota bacterium]